MRIKWRQKLKVNKVSANFNSLYRRQAITLQLRSAIIITLTLFDMQGDIASELPRASFLI
jgi:hypothetical protein